MEISWSEKWSCARDFGSLQALRKSRRATPLHCGRASRMGRWIGRAGESYRRAEKGRDAMGRRIEDAAAFGLVTSSLRPTVVGPLDYVTLPSL